MKKIIYSLSLLGAAMIVAFFVNEKKQVQSVSDLTLTNVKALARTESLDCTYIRDEGTCTINVGAGGKIKLLSGTILTADVNGNITFEGKVVCSGGGSSSCTPVECVDLYKVIL